MSCNQLSYCPESVWSPATSADRIECFASPVTTTRRQVAMNAAYGGLGPLSATTTPFTAPVNIVSAGIDTRCVGSAAILLNFSGTITLPASSIVTLNIQIRRTGCGGQSAIIGSTYTFSETAAALKSESFGFQLYDPNVRPGFYIYSAELSTSSSIAGPSGVTISNAVLSILAVPVCG